MIKLFSFGLDEQQYSLLQKIGKYIEKRSKPVEVIDLRSFDPDINKDDIVLVFGNRAKNITEEKESRFRLELPEIYSLEPSLDENKKDRQETLDKINQLLQALKSNNNEDLPKTESTVAKTDKLNITEELPKELTVGVIKTLEKQQIDKGLDYWMGSTTDGRSIKITIQPEKDTADINLTFAELYAVIGLKEAFRVKELEFVYKSSSSSDKDNG